MSKIRFMMIEADDLSAQTLSQLMEIIAGRVAAGPPGAVHSLAETTPAVASLAPAPAPPVRPPSPADDRPDRRPRLMLACDQHPGEFTVKEAARLARCSESGVRQGVRIGREVNGLRFRRKGDASPATPVPAAGADEGDDDDAEDDPAPPGRPRTRGEADADLMPVNPGFHRPRDPEPARPPRFVPKS